MEAGVEITSSREGNIWCIRIEGELTRNAEGQLFGMYPWLHGQSDVRFILFDMRHLNYLNSAGIALVIRFVREARHRQHSAFAFGVSAHYQKIFRIVGLTSYMELFADEYSAIETLRARSEYGE